MVVKGLEIEVQIKLSIRYEFMFHVYALNHINVLNIIENHILLLLLFDHVLNATVASNGYNKYTVCNNTESKI